MREDVIQYFNRFKTKVGLLLKGMKQDVSLAAQTVGPVEGCQGGASEGDSSTAQRVGSRRGALRYYYYVGVVTLKIMFESR